MPNQFFRVPKITFIRHAESCWNAPRVRVQGRSPDPSITLTKAGRLSVKPTLATLSKPRILLSSPLPRCIQTAEAWFDLPFERIPVQTKICPDLSEIHAGIYEGRWLNELKNDPLWQQWISDPMTFPGFPEGETPTEFYERVLRATTAICAEYGNIKQPVYVITHGVFMRALKCLLADQDLRHLWTYQVTNLEQIYLSDAQILKFQRSYTHCSISPDNVSPKRF